MSTEKFTPGPWAVEPDHDGTLHIAAGVWPVGHHICSIDPRDGGSNEDNARLIAAAPDMLAALELVWDKVLTEYHSKNSYVRQQVEAAIAKAREA